MEFKKILLILTSLVFITACSTTDNKNIKDNDSNKTSVTEKENKYEIIDRFISSYEKQYNNPINDVQKMDIKGEDYRTEFRLGAFDDAVGKKGFINNYKIEMVNYGSWSNDSFRIYLTADSNENALNIFKQLIKIIDKSVTDDDVDKNINTNPSYVNFSFEDKTYITSYIKGSEIFIDTTKIKF